MCLQGCKRPSVRKQRAAVFAIIVSSQSQYSHKFVIPLSQKQALYPDIAKKIHFVKT